MAGNVSRVHKRNRIKIHIKKTIDESIAEKCNEISCRDNKYWELVKQVASSYNKMKSSISPEYYSILRQLESNSIKLQAYTEIIIYKGCMKNILRNCS
jgi:hypothetical protein